jgi:hypothetical protein
MKLTVNTQAEILPTKPIGPLEIFKLVKSFTGKTLTVTIDGSKTIDELEDANDALIAVDPTVVISDYIVIGSSGPLDKKQTVAASGLKDGDSIKYAFVLRV